MTIFGALPFVINQDIPNYIDALFETMSGFTTTGESVSSSTQVNGTWSSSEKGWYFYTNSEKTQSIFFPALGYRSYSTMRPGSIGTQGCFWSAHPVAKGNNYYLRTSSVDVQPTYMVDRGFGYALRPCQD